MIDCTQFEELKPLQQMHCQILDDLDRFCTENGIQWCLARGSALGAARHGGPIPWDDDADIYMTAEEYGRFRKLFAAKGDHERYYLQELDCADGMLSMPKLRMNGTTFMEQTFQNYDMHQGIYVDIYLLHGCPPAGFSRFKSAAASYYILLKRLSNRHYTRRKIVRPLMAFLRWFPADFAMASAYRQLYQWNSTECSQLADWEMWKGNPRWFLDRDVIFPVRRAAYNEYSFPVPNQVDKYLTAYYGNWKEAPSLDQIRWNQHAVTWSTTEDFRALAPNIHDFRDEKMK